MKKVISLMTTVTLVAVLTSTFTLTSCTKENRSSNTTNTPALSTMKMNSSAPSKIKSILIYNKVVDANGAAPMGDATLLFDAVGKAPVTAPDGHQIMLGEFNMASGWADVKCINMGTHVVVHLAGLIPKGVYTIWTMVLKSPGYNGTFDNIIGIGALGAGDGSQNVFTASAGGTASLSVTVPAGNLSAFGSVGNCFSSEFEVLLGTAYHMDGLTHGGVPGDESTWIFQSGFPVLGAQL